MITKDPLVAIIFPLVAGLVGAFQVRRLNKIQRETKSWLQTKGFIVESKIIGFGKGRTALVIYQYFTPDTIVGSRICPTGCEEGDPKVYLQRYGIGKEIDVYFDPTDPQQSYLELPSNRVIYAWTIMGAIGLACPLVYLLWTQYLKES